MVETETDPVKLAVALDELRREVRALLAHTALGPHAAPTQLVPTRALAALERAAGGEAPPDELRVAARAAWEAWNGRGPYAGGGFAAAMQRLGVAAGGHLTVDERTEPERAAPEGPLCARCRGTTHRPMPICTRCSHPGWSIGARPPAP